MEQAAAEFIVDKSEWDAGPWHQEPDKLNWVDPETGLDCMIVRAGEIGHLCGYVGVPPNHPYHGKNYWDENGGPDVQVHGGLTYADKCSGVICHVAEEGREENLWWFGFDCGHRGDLSPGMMATMRKLRALSEYGRNYVYRDIEYVKEQCRLLARQLKELGR